MSYAVRFDQELKPTIHCENVDQVLELIERVQGRPAPAPAPPTATVGGPRIGDLVAVSLPAPEKRPGPKPQAADEAAAGAPPSTESRTAAPAPAPRAGGDPNLSPVVIIGGHVKGAGRATIEAFSSDQNYPLERLAAHIYGDDGKESMRQLGWLLSSMVKTSKLKKLGRTTYKALQAP